jgi:hypothetical protein
MADGKVVSESAGTVMILNDDKASLLAAAAGTQPEIDLLTRDQLDPIVAEAISRWDAVLGDDADVAARVGSIQFQIEDFNGLTLGLTDGSTITMDADAAGWGWFVDPTPEDDVEFSEPGGDDDGRMDLLTAVMHEIGHVLGYEDLAGDADHLMSATLDAGQRVAPAGETRNLVVMDTSDLMDGDEPRELTVSTENAEDSWLINFLVKTAREKINPFEPLESLRIVLAEEELEEE